MSKDCCEITSSGSNNQVLKKILWVVLIINVIMFMVEIVAGYIYKSAALTADSLDMLSDSFVYGMSLFVLTGTALAKARVSLMKGIVMTLMALYVVNELWQRLLYPVTPDGQMVSLVGGLALLANIVCFWLLSKQHISGSDINIRSAWICSRNDLVANTGVIVAGIWVVRSGSHWPDYLIGAAIAILVLFSSFQVVIDAVREIRRKKM